MLFIGLFFIFIAGLLIFLKLKCMITGRPVEGEIVGYVRGAKGAYGFVGYSYRIRLEYKEEVYYVTAMEGVTTNSENIPKKNLGMACCVYFNPKAPKKTVAIKGFHRTEWLTALLLLIGLLSILLELIMMI
ncbi:hypothetical protein J14TS2_05190 [Bacillus sp. J14TS2]|uniref:DUF3592 domain-containing protein n=1 Tax=Bacillus sp. J14TS2 TaxID=2807188 RepID=UPI001B25E2AE|nr:DUF3592 domain-containing protein [Bacillus sp. J14TS2]GIN70044.1 hypothetical protein J14TS2_05190 [Bacillus sp. J14TS2]